MIIIDHRDPNKYFVFDCRNLETLKNSFKRDSIAIDIYGVRDFKRK